MKDIAAVDPNFKIETQINKSDIHFYDVNVPPFAVYGVFYDHGKYRRMPESVAKAVSGGVWTLHTNTAGGRVRFKTDSPYIAIHAKMPSVGKMPHFALTGSAGFDLYVRQDGQRYVHTFAPPFTVEDGYESVMEFGNAAMRELTVNFPLYSEVSALYIGVSDTASLCPPEPYRIQKPIVFYGSSITQGGCASRPGAAYESIVSRRLDCDYINLGFSGSAMGEDAIAEYISGLTMSAFVYDYDHNAPTVEHLANTHEKMFRLIRAKNPELPIVLLSRPKYYLTQEEEQRLAVIQSTYTHARENGDQHVYLLDGRALLQMAGNEGTVDNCHPTDLGFASMAAAVGNLLAEII